MSDRDAAELTDRLGRLAEAGLALPGGLRALAEESEGGAVREALLRIADRIEEGESLDLAIGAEGRRLPEHLRALISAGCRSGRLAEVLDGAARFERIGRGLRDQILIRLFYPAFLLSAFAVLVVVISFFTVEGLEEMVEDFGVNLSPLTSWLIALGRVVREVVWAVPLMVALIVAGLLMAARRSTGRGGRRVASKFPLLGPVWRGAALAEFSSLLALLIDCRLTIPEALPLAGRGVADPDLAVACDGAAHAVLEGRTLSDAALTYRIFPDAFGRMLTWAESHEVLPDALRMAAELFEARARGQTRVVGIFALAATIALILMGLILIVFGTYLPMISLLSSLSG